MQSPNPSDNTVEVWAHGKMITIETDPLLEILYKLRPRLPDETPKQRVEAVKTAYKAIHSLTTQARIDEHKVFWEIVPSEAEHVGTVKDISDLRVLKLKGQL